MLIHEITARNLLSFGPKTPSLKMQKLNVLIGPNGSGKSNLIDAISMLRAAPTHLATPVREGGGVLEWIWKGKPHSTAVLEVVVDHPQTGRLLQHRIEFAAASQRFELIAERIDGAGPPPRRPIDAQSHYKFVEGEQPLLYSEGILRRLRPRDLASDESILSQIKDSQTYPEITWLGLTYKRIRFFQEWSFGRCTIHRQPQKTDQPNDFLNSDATNLALVLNRYERDREAKQHFLDYLRELYDGSQDYRVQVEGGTVQLFLQEPGFDIPATRLSDGTFRYLCLLAILCDPDPPPLICIEEPELGLHPDIIPTIAKLLREASERTQLIVTTHSDILVDALTETPECVVVCEKHDGQTTMKRLDEKKLSKWLEKYRLGELWTKGEIGGVRW